jgi:spore maturation protein CgeB
VHVRPRTAVVVCDQWLGSNGYAGMKALRRAEWMVSVVPEWEHVPVRWNSFAMRALGRCIRHPATQEFNGALVNEVRASRADLLLVFKGRFVSPDALRAIRTNGTLAYCFFPDNSFRAHGRYLPTALPEYDWVYTAKSFGLRDMKEQLGVTTASLLLHGFDPDLHCAGPVTADDEMDFGADVSFIGTWSPKKEKYLSALASARPHLKMRIFGGSWTNARAASLRTAVSISGPIHGQAYVRAIRVSKINLAILSERRDGSSADDQITSRTFHIPASGAFMLHERTPEVLATLREDAEVGCFGDEAEMISAVDRWLARPEDREAVAAAGHRAVLRSHSWDHRIRVILDDHSKRRVNRALELVAR